MIKIIWVLLIAVSANGYEYIPNQKLPTTLTYSCNDPVLEDSFLRMFKIWNFACDNIFTISKVENDGTISLVSYPALQIQFLGVTIGSKIFIRDTSYRLDVTVLHELGHALGMAHSDVKQSIMRAQLKTEATLVQDDVDGIREHYDLSPKTFNFDLKIKNKGAVCKSSYGKVDWYTDNVTKCSKQKTTFRCRDVDTVEMIYNGVSVYKELKNNGN